MASPIACGLSDLHHSYITHGAITCNGRQTREKNPAYLSGFCKCVQSLETPRISLVMSRGKRFESARRLSDFPANPVKTRSPRCSCRGLCQQYVSSRLSQSFVLGIGVLQGVAGYSRWCRRILYGIYRLSDVPGFGRVRYRRRSLVQVPRSRILRTSP
jgi:hypothetical protein